MVSDECENSCFLHFSEGWLYLGWEESFFHVFYLVKHKKTVVNGSLSSVKVNFRRKHEKSPII